jgi:hypothetical protein
VPVNLLRNLELLFRKDATWLTNPFALIWSNKYSIPLGDSLLVLDMFIFEAHISGEGSSLVFVSRLNLFAFSVFGW